MTTASASTGSVNTSSASTSPASVDRAIEAYESGPAKLRAACAGLTDAKVNTRIGPGA